MTSSFNSSEKGLVVARVDPMRLGRVKVLIAGIHPQNCPIEDLPWAFPRSFAGPGFGLFTVPPIGTFVNVSFYRNDPNYLEYHGGWWADQESVSGKRTYRNKEGKYRWDTSWFGSEVPRSKDSPLKGEEGSDSINSPDNFSFSSPLAKRLELDDRNGKERVVLADYFGNGLFVNTEHGALTLDSFLGKRPYLKKEDPYLCSLTLSSDQKAFQVTTGGWRITANDASGIFEASSASGSSLRISQSGRAEVFTPRGGRMVIDDQIGRADIQTPFGRKVSVDDHNEICVVQGVGANQYFVINDKHGFVEVFASNIKLKAEENLNLSAGGAMTLDARAIFLNSGFIDLTRQYLDSGSFLKSDRSPLIKKAYDYEQYQDSEKTTSK